MNSYHIIIYIAYFVERNKRSRRFIYHWLHIIELYNILEEFELVNSVEIIEFYWNNCFSNLSKNIDKLEDIHSTTIIIDSWMFKYGKH